MNKQISIKVSQPTISLTGKHASIKNYYYQTKIRQMFNIYQFENEIKEQIQMEKKRSIEEQWKQKRQSQKDQMVENYKIRLNQFLSEVKQKPIKIYDDIVDMKLNLINKFRPEDESKMIGPKIMRLKDYPTRAHSPQNQNFKQNQNISLDMHETNKSINQMNPYTPFKPHQFRSREKNKELYGEMKFKASYKNERIVDSICQQGIGGLRSDHPYVPQTAPMTSTKKVSLRDQIGKIRIRPSTTAAKNEGLISNDNSQCNLGINKQTITNREGIAYTREIYLYGDEQNNEKSRKDSHILLQNQQILQNQQANLSLLKARKSLSNHFAAEMYDGNTQNNRKVSHNLNKSLPYDSNVKSLTSHDNQDEEDFINQHRKDQNTYNQRTDINLKKNIKIEVSSSDRAHSIQINPYLNSQRNDNQHSNNISSISQRNRNYESIITPEKTFYQNQMIKSQHHNNSSIKGQNILPVLHQKTHFKALTELAIKQPLLKSELKERYDETLIGNVIETNQIFDDQTTQDAFQVMNECNIFRTKNKHVKGIRGTLRNTSNNFNQNHSQINNSKFN